MSVNQRKITILSLFIFMSFVFATSLIFEEGTYGFDKSDIPILNRAMNEYKANLELVRTWQGTVYIEYYDDGPSVVSDFSDFKNNPTSTNEVIFKDDIVTGNSLCINRIVQGAEKGRHDETCTLFADGVSYEISRFINEKNQTDNELPYESQMTVKLIDRASLSQLLATHFIPMENCDYNQQVFKSLEKYIEIGNKFDLAETSHITINISENILTIESSIQGSLSRYSVDMNCGAMPVEFLTCNSDKKGIHWKCNLQNHEGIWIPKESWLIADLSDGTTQWSKYRWIKNDINTSLPKDTFTIQSLNVHRGTSVYDYRTGEQYVITDSVSPPAPDNSLEYKRSRYVRYITILVGFTLILIGLIFKYVYWKRRHYK